MNSELFKAILAMDSYNRGYGEGIKLIGTQIGNATIIKESDTADGTAGVAAGFYAIAYKDNTTGQTTISYRGTNADNLSNFAIDAWYGYGIGAGTPCCRAG